MRISASHLAIFANDELSVASRSNLRTSPLYHCSIGRLVDVDAAYLHGRFPLSIFLWETAQLATPIGTGK